MRKFLRVGTAKRIIFAIFCIMLNPSRQDDRKKAEGSRLLKDVMLPGYVGEIKSFITT
jgi:hypothetical protein